MSVVMLADGAFTLPEDVAGRVASVKVPTAAHPGRRPLLSGEVAAFFGVTPVAAEFEEVEDAVTAASRRPRVDVPGVPGGDSMYLRLKNLWNDPGTGRFVKRGRSTAKAQAMMFVPGDAVREVARAKGRVRARVADNRMSRSGIRRGDVIEVGYRDDKFGVVEVLSSSGKKRKYQVQWARFDQVEADTPDLPDRSKPTVSSRTVIADGWPVGEPYGLQPDMRQPLSRVSLDGRDVQVQSLGGDSIDGTYISKWVMTDGPSGDVMGWLDYTDSDDEFHIDYIEVDEKYRGQGVADALLAFGLANAGQNTIGADRSTINIDPGYLLEDGAAWWDHVGPELETWRKGSDNVVGADTPDVPEVPEPSRVGRGMKLDLPYEQAQPFIDGTATVDDVMRLVDEDTGIGLWWGELGDTFGLSDLQDYADYGGGYPNEEGPNSGWMQVGNNDGNLSVVFLADKPEGWSADDNPDMTGGFSAYGFAGSENSWIDPDKFGSSLRLRSIQYRAGDGEWATIDVPDERRVPIAPPGEADTPDVVDSVRAQEADILQIALDNGGGDFPDCLEASEEINKRFGLPVEQGFFYGSQPGEAYNKMNWAPHAWVRLPDGSILDLTSNQFSAGAGPGTQVIRPGDPSYGRYWTEGKGMWETRKPDDALGWLQAGGVDVVEAPPVVRGTASKEWFDKTIGSQPWYHVTGFDRAAAILANGLDPSYGGLQSDATAPPRPGAVYLAHKTMVDAGLAGNPLAELLDIDRPVTLEFDTSKLAYDRVVPDEDYFTIAEWEKPEAYGLPAWDPETETSGAWAQRVGLGEQPGIVEKVVGQDNRFAYGGPVPAAAVKRVRFDAYFDEDDNLVPASDWLTPEEALAVLSGEAIAEPNVDMVGPGSLPVDLAAWDKRRQYLIDEGYRSADYLRPLDYATATAIQAEVQKAPIVVHVPLEVMDDVSVEGLRGMTDPLDPSPGGDNEQSRDERAVMERLNGMNDGVVYAASGVQTEMGDLAFSPKSASAYGDVKVTLTDAVKQRAYFTPEDSLFTESIPLPIVGDLLPEQVERSFVSPVYELSEGDYAPYIEVQVPGRVPVSDFAAVEIETDRPLSDFAELAQRLLNGGMSPDARFGVTGDEATVGEVAGGGEGPMLVSSRMAEAPDRIDVTTMQADPTTGTPQRHMVMSVDESGEWAARPLDWSTRNSSRQQTFDLYHGGTPDQSPEGKRQALALEGLAKRQAIANGPLVFMPAAGAPQLRDPNFDYERLRDENYVMGATRQTGVVLDRSALDKLWFKVSTFVGADTPLEAPLLGPADTELDAQIGTFDTDVEYRGDFSKAPVIGRVLMGMRLTTDDNGRVLVRRNIYGDDVQNPYNSEPIDYAKFDTDTIFFTPTQVDGLPSGTLENEGKLADAAGKRLAVLENNGNIVPWNAYVHPVPRPDAEGWAGPAPYAPQGNMANGYSNYVRFTIDRNHRLGGPTVEEELPRLRELRDTATDRMYVRVPTEALPGIVKSKGLKNQHQSRASGGYFSPKVRREGEATLFGLPEEGGFPTKDRPISGFVSTSADQGLTRYGNFAIKIKPETANRTTITFGDSLTVAAPMFEYARKPDGMRGKQEVGFVPERHGIALPLLGPVDDNQLLAASEVSYIRGLDAEYIELQFHGGVSFSDMEAVEYHTPTFFVGREPMDPAQTAAEVNSDLVAYAASPIPGLPLRLDDFAAENVTPETTQALADAGVEVLTGGGEGPMLVSSRMAEAPVKVNDGLPSVTNIEPVSRDELNDDEVLKQSWRQPFAEDNRRLSRELGEARMAGLRRAPIIVSADAIEYRPGQGIPMNQSADATFAAPGYSYPQLSRDAAVNPRGFGYVLGPSALADVAVTPGVDLPPEIGLTDPNPSDDLLIQMGWHDGSTDAFYRGKMPPDDVRGIVLLTGPAPIAASGQEPRWRLQDSSYPAYEGDGRYDTTWPPIDYEMLPGDTVFLSAVQATDNPEQTRREMAIAAAAGKGMKVLRNNGDIVDVEQVLAEYETAKVATPDDWTGPVPLKPEGNEGNRHAEFVRRIFDDAGLARPGRAPYTFSRNHDWYAGGRAHAEDADKFVTEMRDVRDGAEDRMVIRVPLEVIPLLIEDGRLKNQHESKQSEGTLDPRQRKDAERLLFGIPTRGGKVKDRPIYGLVETDGYRDGAQYGKFVISLKPETARRTTMTFGDSLGVANATYGYNTQDGVRKSKKKDEPDLRSAHGAAIPMTGDVSDEQILGATQANASNRAYVEIQVHGGVTLDDMRSVRYSPWIQNDDSTRADLLEYAKNPIPGLPLELPQDVYDIAGPEVIDALTGAGVTVVAVAPTGVGAL